MSKAPAPKRRRALRWMAALGGLGALGLGARAASSPAETRFPPLGSFRAVEGTRIHLLDQGPKDAPALVLIHGASGNIRDFGFGFTEGLRERYRVIAVDRPGHGHSERGPSDAYRVAVQARLIRGAVAQLGVERALVLGHSFGCAAALAWALDAPESVLGVIDVAGVAMPFPGDVDSLYHLNDAPLVGFVVSNAINAFASEAYVEEQIAEIFQPNAPPPGYAAKIGAALAIRPETLRANGEDVANVKPQLREMAARYPAMAAPVEILHGRADEIAPAAIHATGLAAAAPRTRLTLLEGIGHMPHHAARAEVYAAIDRLAARP